MAPSDEPEGTHDAREAEPVAAAEPAAAPAEEREAPAKADRKPVDEHDRRSKDDSKNRDGGKEASKRSSRRSRSRSRDKDKDRKTSRRSRSRDKDSRKSTNTRDRSDSRDRRRGGGARRVSRSRSRDRKKPSVRRSRSRDRRRSRSRDKAQRRSRSREAGRKVVHRDRSRSTSSDGVGGYKPRKRQDSAPLMTNGPGTGADPYSNMRPAAVASHDPQAQVRMWQLQQLEARAMVLEQQAKSAATATSKTQREVYVGGLIPGAVTGEALRTLFNSALAVQFSGFLMPGMDPVINVNMHPEGKYSFVEFRAPEMATAALALSGQVQLLGCNLSVARPSGYVDPSKALNASQAANAALVAFKRGDMAGVAAAALAGANLRGLGLPPHIEDPATAAAPVLPAGVVIDGLSPVPTHCLCLTGMVTAQRLASDAEYLDMKEDLKEQMNEFIADCCVEVKIPRPYDPILSDQYLGIANYGKIFAKLTTPEAAQVCKDKIHGRLYGGTLVQVFFISEEAHTSA
mmetsp:Transcript_2672/g.4565  ORF Transcript_2672/g.4565 Transcript_2672/m.4565 type:complete len:515 (-) Transcript_2672:447-1991(-)|eukprot:CAMPEP_0119107258 /NCGR_PEP_ID=MMETSP1180-20130426/9600_1 /TAXON_ID=3052 ORGANISM="Chlamydomonas cf sp, Strain CCMP681" /NCGR_SAMPLE_ID=MMETSP1180 /ASSEMBLY_ACC=CAM_ASM_000741 /LENGTH=514 /DNA_ID=CAMNT_0007092719 /DNA_START=24 /DNA_END=1568 /DNA_ORIENTATION=+